LITAQHQDLTPGERRFLERLDEAATEGVTLQEYYRAHGLSLPALYSVRRQLISKGVLPPAHHQGRPVGKTAVSPGRFVAVRVAAPVAAASVSGCRLRSPSGWLIECDGLPDLAWLAGLMRLQP
jgi:hypothetical protein